LQTEVLIARASCIPVTRVLLVFADLIRKWRQPIQSRCFLASF